MFRLGQIYLVDMISQVELTTDWNSIDTIKKRYLVKIMVS